MRNKAAEAAWFSVLPVKFTGSATVKFFLSILLTVKLEASILLFSCAETLLMSLS